MKKIEFNKKFDCVICLDGEPPDAEVFNLLENIPILAADGAAFYLDKMGLTPHKIIGDLDTFSKKCTTIDSFSTDQIVHISDQETNDFEKVLKYAIENNYNNCLILGINGGEFEHSLNNWSVLIRYSNYLNLCVLTKKRYSFLVNENICIKLIPGEIISLIPQPVVTLSTKNLVWELQNESLSLGVREGARNCAKHEDIYINIHFGNLLLCIEERLPYYPSFSKYFA